MTGTAQERIRELMRPTKDQTVADLAAASGLARSTVSAVLAALRAEGSVVQTARRQPGRPGRWRAAPVTKNGTDIATDTQASRRLAPPVDGWRRLGSIREEVLVVLAEAAEAPMTPHAMGRRTGRSAGAIRNAAEKLHAEGRIDVASSKPRSYSAKS